MRPSPMRKSLAFARHDDTNVAHRVREFYRFCQNSERVQQSYEIDTVLPRFSLKSTNGPGRQQLSPLLTEQEAFFR